MKKNKKKYLFSENNYFEIMIHLEKEKKFRDLFFENPEKAVESLGIQLSEEEKQLLKLLKKKYSEKTNVKNDFDERLVLCSSPGY